MLIFIFVMMWCNDSYHLISNQQRIGTSHWPARSLSRLRHPSLLRRSYSADLCRDGGRAGWHGIQRPGEDMVRRGRLLLVVARAVGCLDGWLLAWLCVCLAACMNVFVFILLLLRWCSLPLLWWPWRSVWKCQHRIVVEIACCLWGREASKCIAWQGSEVMTLQFHEWPTNMQGMESADDHSNNHDTSWHC